MARPLTSLFALLRTTVYAALFISLWVYWIPTWMAPRRPWLLGWNHLAPTQWLGILLISLGAVITLGCMLVFSTRGQGTPAPFDAPRFLVKNWLYRHVRNPMYIGMVIVLLGEALLFPTHRASVLASLAILLISAHLFILGYEEPNLRRRFGAAYEDYCRHVRRWLPRLRPYRSGQPRGL